MRLTTFASGSSGNCALLEMDGVSLLLDAGVSAARIRENLELSGLEPEALSAILVTHTHSDHVSGLPNLLKRFDIPVYAPRTVANHLRYTMAGVEHFLRELPVGEPTTLGPLTLRPFHTPHDTPESVGWRVEGSEIFALATDMGCVTDEVLDGLTGADVALIESNHDEVLLRSGPYPAHLKKRILSDHGHLSNAACGILAAYLADHGAAQLILGHLSRENNRPELAFRTVKAALGDRSVDLLVAPAAERLTIEYTKEQPCLL